MTEKEYGYIIGDEWTRGDMDEVLYGIVSRLRKVVVSQDLYPTTEWHDAEKDPPKKAGEYLCRCRIWGGGMDCRIIRYKSKRWWRNLGPDCHFDVIKWMPIPDDHEEK